MKNGLLTELTWQRPDPGTRNQPLDDYWKSGLLLTGSSVPGNMYPGAAAGPAGKFHFSLADLQEQTKYAWVIARTGSSHRYFRQMTPSILQSDASGSEFSARRQQAGRQPG